MKEDCQDSLVNGDTLASGKELIDTAQAVGSYQAFDQILHLTYREENKDEESTTED